jgi:hypothetical protein
MSNLKFFSGDYEEWRILGYENKQIAASLCYVRFEVFTAVIIKNVVFWDINPRLYLTGETYLR